MSGLFGKELRSKRTATLSYCLAVFMFVLLYTSIFPTFQKQSASFGKIFESLPKGFSNSVGVGLNTFSDVQHFLSIELFTFLWPILAVLISVSTIGNSIAGEVERGTMGTLLSLQLGRAKIYWTKYFVGVLMILAFTCSSIIAAMPLASLFGLDYSPKAFLLTAVICFTFALAVYSFAAMLSSIFNEKSRVYAICGGLLMMMYVANIVSGLVKDLEFFKYGSIFYYFTARQTLGEGHLNLTHLLVLVVPVLIFSLAGFVIFKRKDIAV